MGKGVEDGGWLPVFGFFSCLAEGHEKNSGESPLFFSYFNMSFHSSG